MHRALIIPALISIVFLSGQAASHAEEPAAPPPQAAVDIRPSGRPIHLYVNQGTLVQLPAAGKTLFVANSEVADAQLVPTDPQLVFITARKAGATVLYVTDIAGNIVLNKFVDVTGAVTIIRGARVDTGEPPPGPLVLQIPLQVAPTR